MARFVARLDAPVPAGRVWDRLVDWPAHGQGVPLTTVRVLTPSGAGVGARFVGRTGIGPLGFDDPMEVVEWRPPTDAVPGFCRVEKLGRIVLGGAWFEVAPTGPGSCRVTWTEDIEIVPVRLTRPLAPLVAVVGRLAFTRVLRQAVARAGRD